MRIVPLEHGINFRELGGISAGGGKVKHGVLFRSGALCQLSPNDCLFLSQTLKLTSILDYRDESEIEMRPDKLWHGVNYYHAPANPFNSDVSATLEQGSGDTITGTDLKKYYPSDFMVKLYQVLPFHNPAYKKLIMLLQESEMNVGYYCSA